MPEAIVDAVRTPIGRAVKGSLKDVRADDLAAVPLSALVERNPEVDFAETDDLMMGCGFQAGEQGYNVGRSAQLLAGIDHHVPATTVNRFCASSLQTLRMAFHAIKVGEGDQYIAAGVEAVSRLDDSPIPFHPKLDGSDGSFFNVYIPMGLTAENVAERCNVSRESQDEWAATSQQRDRRRPRLGPLRPRDRRGHARGRHRGHPARRPAPRHDGREARRAQAGVPPRRHRDCRQRLPAQRRRRRRPRDVGREGRRARPQAPRPHHRLLRGGDPPGDHGPRPDPGGKKVLERAGMTIDDIDVLELNEAFAAQVVPCRDEWGIDPEKLNPNGGAIALGHPFGMTGARIMTTLLNNLDALDGTIGLETMCVAGGQGQAMIVERLN